MLTSSFSFQLDGSVLDPLLFDIFLSYYPKAPTRTTVTPPSSSPYNSYYTDILLSDDDFSLSPVPPPPPSTSMKGTSTSTAAHNTKSSATIYDSEFLVLLTGGDKESKENDIMTSNQKEFAAFKHGSYLLYTQRGLLETLPLRYVCVSVSPGASVREELRETEAESSRTDPLLAAYLNVHQPMKHLGYMFSRKKDHPVTISSVTTPISHDSSLPPLLSNILDEPKELFLYVDSLKPGSAYSVVIDFKQPIALTDISIQSSSHVFSVGINVWLNKDGEESESLTIAQSNDLSQRALMIGNLLPPPVIQYARVTYIGSMNASNEKCVLSLGQFYGKPVIEDSNRPHDSALLALETKLLSQYHKQREELKDVLAMYTQGNSSSVLKKQLKKQVKSVHQSCFKAQVKLARFRHIVQELRHSTAIKKGLFSLQKMELSPLSSLSAKKLFKCISCVIDAMLILTQSATSTFKLYRRLLEAHPLTLQSIGVHITKSDCRDLFLAVCIHSSPTVHARLCALLVMLCGGQPWWGELLSEVFADLFSSNQSILFDKERSVYS